MTLPDKAHPITLQVVVATREPTRSFLLLNRDNKRVLTASGSSFRPKARVRQGGFSGKIDTTPIGG